MYKGLVSEDFKHAVKKLDKKELAKCLNAILKDPYHARGSEELKHKYSGFRAARFDQVSRVIFRVCEECHAKNNRELHPLDCCEDTSESKELNIVRFVDYGNYHRKAKNPPRLKKEYAFVEIVALVPDEDAPNQAGNT